MRVSNPLSLLVVTACAVAQEPQQSSIEKLAVELAVEPPPGCTAGHEKAVSSGAVTIHPGETICVVLKVRGQSVIATGATSTNSDKTLVLRFWQDPGTKAMVLTVHNPLGEYLRYKAHMLLPGVGRHEYTSSCPVLSNRLAIEHWPHPISELVLSNFELLPDSATITCE
jgi:hypothetical protein